MRKFKQLAVLLLVIFLFDYIYFSLNLVNSRKDSALSNSAYQLVMLGLFLLAFLTLCYRSVFTLKSPAWVILSTLLVCIGLSVFISGRLKFLMLAYDREFTRRDNTRVEEHLHRFDDRMLWRGNPNAKGFYHFNIGDTLTGKVEVIYDSLGHKSVPDSLRVATDTLDMIIGCSFSYGNFVKGEEGYPYLVTKALNHRFMNASMGGYGLAQMQMRLDSLLPAHRFRYVFIQMSPWLADRAMSISGIFARGYPPVHYFARSDSGIKLMPHAYPYTDFTKLGGWHLLGRSYYQRMRYFLTSGFELQVKGYLRMRYAELKVFLGILPGPIEDKGALERIFYDKAISDVRKSGAIPVLVKFYWNDGSFEPLRRHLQGKALIVDCDRRLDSVVNATGKSAIELYRLYVEKDGRKLYYDVHPNPYANRLMAEEILARMAEAR